MPSSLLTTATNKLFPSISGTRLLPWVLAILAIQAFAVFSYGAYFQGAMTFCVVSIWVLFLTCFLYRKEDFIPRRRGSLVPAFLLVGLWFWTGFSVFWSIASDLSWQEFNRTGGYLAVFTLGMAISRSTSARKLAAGLFLAIATAAAVYGLCIKLLPNLVDNADNLARISLPIGYVNGMGLLVALAIPLALYFSASKQGNAVLRLLAMLATPLLLLCLFFTLSRGAFIALALGLIVFFALTPLRLRSFFVLLAAGLPSFLIALWSTGQDALMLDRVDLKARMEAAGSLRPLLVIALVALAVVFLLALLAGRLIQVPRMVTRIGSGLVLATILFALIVGSILFVSSKPSFGEWASQSYEEITKPPEISTVLYTTGYSRLFEIGSTDRWQLWQEAVANWQENVVKGSGAQSFPLTHLIFRQNNISVKQPHGIAFRLLTELGVIGFALGGAFISITLLLAMLGWARLRDRSQKALMGTFIAVMIIYLIHASFDWDWNIFALTMPFMFFGGVAVGWFGELHAKQTGVFNTFD